MKLEPENRADINVYKSIGPTLFVFLLTFFFQFYIIYFVT